jgi:hypothetical protein
MDAAKRGWLLMPIGALALASCATFKAAAIKVVSKVLATVPTDVTETTKVWGIAKGIALVALPAITKLDPVLAGTVNLAIVGGDKLIAELPTLETDAAKLAAALSQIQTNAQQILIAGAPQITAQANMLISPT